MSHPTDRHERLQRKQVLVERVRRNMKLYRMNDDDADRLAKRNADNRQPCSCEGCGNPRKRGELPVAELRERDALADDLAAL
jgi:hypothetical protein